MKKPTVVLDKYELQLCANAAKTRHSNGRKNKRKDVSSSAHSSFMIDLIGVCGEVALIKYFDLEIDWNDILTAFGTTDVGDCWEVRSVSQQHYHLCMWTGGGADETKIKKKLLAGWSKVVVNIVAYQKATCTLDGWAFGYDMRDFGYQTFESDNPFNANRIQRPSLIFDNSYLRQHLSPEKDMNILRYLRQAFANK